MMKRLLLLGCLAATPAAAGDMLQCVLTDNRGNGIGYTFVRGPGDTLLEIGAGRNGSVLMHAPDKRPIWSAFQRSGLVVLTYEPDPRFALHALTRARVGNYIPTLLVRDSSLRIARGRCEIKGEDPDLPEFWLE